jgi:hypothetical protein
VYSWRRRKGTDGKVWASNKWRSHGALDVQAPSLVAGPKRLIAVGNINFLYKSTRPRSEFSSSNELRCPQPTRSFSPNL